MDAGVSDFRRRMERGEEVKPRIKVRFIPTVEGYPEYGPYLCTHFCCSASRFLITSDGPTVIEQELPLAAWYGVFVMQVEEEEEALDVVTLQ